jgi:hypothetical protein
VAAVDTGESSLGNKPFGTEFREIVTKRAEGVVLRGAVNRFDDGWVDLGRREGIAGRDVSKADQRVY